MEEEVVEGPTGPAVPPEPRREHRAPTESLSLRPQTKVLGPAWDFTSLGSSRLVLK